MLDDEVVVLQDEELLQQELARALCGDQHKRLLEIGYGLGLAHRYIMNCDLREHWVVEGNQWLATDCVTLPRKPGSRLPIVLFDTWEHALEILPAAYFDSVLFDPFPFDQAAKSLCSWSEKFQFVAERSAALIYRILSSDGELGIINFDPQACDANWMRNAFSDLFSFHRSLTARTGSTAAEVNLPEVWILRKILF